jgi:anti-sigma factor RsiW
MISENDHELISQYLDGELNQVQTAQLETRLAVESPLSAYLEQLRHTDQALRDSLATQGRVPEHITAMLSQADDKVVPLRPRQQPRWGLAVAASLLAGIAAVNAPRWIAGGPESLLVPDAAESAAFAQVLENQPSIARGWYTVLDSVQMRPVLSFASTGGTWCREFLATQADEAWRGVACRRDEKWDVELLVQTPGLAAENSGYQTASAETADMVATFIDTNSTDIPLGRDEEAGLIANKWQ